MLTKQLKLFSLAIASAGLAIAAKTALAFISNPWLYWIVAVTVGVAIASALAYPMLDLSVAIAQGILKKNKAK